MISVYRNNLPSHVFNTWFRYLIKRFGQAGLELVNHTEQFSCFFHLKYKTERESVLNAHQIQSLTPAAC